ncbi:MAG: DUF2029 domain-containing protein [Anaerolineae bacterium]|nr:DUF2029 domain-containing protein [Anaerolineae bacterium]
MLAHPTAAPPHRSIAQISLGLVTIFAVTILLVIVLIDVWPIGADYYFTFRPVAESFLRGETRLYDAESLGFFKAPWTLLYLIPLTWFSLNTGQAILTVSTLLMLILATHLVRSCESIPRVALVFALLNLHTFDLLIRGQVDHLILLGIALGWWSIWRHRPWGLSLAFWLMAIKPINVVLVAIVYLIAIRHWSRGEQVRALALPVVSLLVSFIFLGADWPLRYIDNYRVFSPPKAYLTLTVWRVARSVDLPFWPLILLAAACVALTLWLAWRVGLNRWTLSLALATNLVFAQYATGNHYVYLIPAVLFVTARSRRAGLLAYLTTFTPLLRLVFGVSIAPIDLLYPIALFVAAWNSARQDGLFAQARSTVLDAPLTPA